MVARRLLAAVGCLVWLGGMPSASTAATAQPVHHPVSLWIGAVPAGEQPAACVRPEARVWQPVDAPRMRLHRLRTDAGEGRLTLKALGAGAATDAWVQQCFQLRHQGRLLLQGVIVSRETVQRVSPGIPVAMLENRSAAVPWMELGCGWPFPGPGWGGNWQATSSLPLRCPH